MQLDGSFSHFKVTLGAMPHHKSVLVFATFFVWFELTTNICMAQEMEDRRREGRLARKGLLDKESRIDPRFRQQMWKLMSKKPSKVGTKSSPSAKTAV